MTELTYWDDLKAYTRKAARLQSMNIHPSGPRDVDVDPGFEDPLMQYVTIYDVVERRYAGFSNAEQQLWYGSSNPKHWQARKEFNGLRDTWDVETWLTVFLIHRATGSGASFAHDHGFRNSILPEFGEHCRTSSDVVEYWLEQARSGRALFTSIGNQPPPFPKPTSDWPRASDAYMAVHARDLVRDVVDHLFRRHHNGPAPIRHVVDIANEWNHRREIKRFNFVYTAWVMDIAEYFPTLVDPHSHCYYGKNALESMSLVASGVKDARLKTADLVMDQYVFWFQSEFPHLTAYPMSLEDVLCDYVRYVEAYVPKGYEHLEPWQIQNRSLVHHPVKHRSYHDHLARHDIASIYGVAT